MSTHQSTGTSGRDPNHALNVRVLRFRHSPHREEPTLLAQELIDLGRHDDALELLEIALARDPGDADLELLRGRALLGAGDVSRAQETLIRAAKAAPGWAAPLTWLTRALSGEGSARAGAVAVRARALGADDTQVMRLAKGHETAARLDARLARYDASPEAEEPVMLARELALGGRKDDAVRILHAAFERDRSDPDTRAALRSLAGVEVAFEEAPEPVMTSERERAVSVLELDIAVEPLVIATPTAKSIDDALDALIARRDETVPYVVEARDTELGAPAVDATLVGTPAPARAPSTPAMRPQAVVTAPVVAVPPVRAELTHGRIRRAGASGWPRRVTPKAEPTATPYVRVLMGDARPRTRSAS